MKITKVIQTFKDNVLTSVQKTNIAPSPAQMPKHHKVLDLADASLLSLRQAAEAQNSLLGEVRQLRKKLVGEQKQILARTKERDSLKKALEKKQNQILQLAEKNEELVALLSSSKDDNTFLEEENAQLKKMLKLSVPKNTEQKLEATTTFSECVRAIAATPKK